MKCHAVAVLVLGLSILAVQELSADDQAQVPKKLAPHVARLVNGSAAEFIKHFDKDKDGTLSKEELPPRLQGLFARFDKNGDGKLDRAEVREMLVVVRERLAVGSPKGDKSTQIDRVVADILRRLDTNKDGKISREEAQGRPVGRLFDQLDANKDGYLDKQELRRAAELLQARKGAGPTVEADNGGPVVDFDALDRNADGRLTRDELKGTPYATHFEDIDTNKDGTIDRKEFTAYLKKQTR
jgi:Ca2+-binding EF-hand superfamily protein